MPRGTLIRGQQGHALGGEQIRHRGGEGIEVTLAALELEQLGPVGAISQPFPVAQPGLQQAHGAAIRQFGQGHGLGGSLVEPARGDVGAAGDPHLHPEVSDTYSTCGAKQ